MQQTDVLIIGGGLSGLHTASELEKRGIDYYLVEARGRLGGRILSEFSNAPGTHPEQPAFDLGPAWFWPGQQRMEELLHALDLSDQVFEQFCDGKSIYEDGEQLHFGIPGFSMAGSYRLQGGFARLISALQVKVDETRVICGAQTISIETRPADVVTTTVGAASPGRFASNLVVLALPPRIAQHTIRFVPELATKQVVQLNDVPTWMAGHAKFIATYAEPHWRSKGFSGDVISNRGPLGEIHDASPCSENTYALFGFVGMTATDRPTLPKIVIDAALQQLARLFGDELTEPHDLFYKDWARDPLTATPLDQVVHEHQTVSANSGSAYTDRQERVLWSGSEMAEGRYSGYLEGALEASQRTVRRIEQVLEGRST